MAYQFIKTKRNSPFSIDVLNMKTNEIEYTIESDKVKKAEKKKMGCLKKGCLFGSLGILILLLTGELDLDGVDPEDSRPASLTLYDKKQMPILQYKRKRVRKGVELYQESKKVGSMKFEKRTLITKQEIYLHGNHIGKVIPKSIWHNELDIKKGEKLMARFTKSKKRNIICELQVTKGGISPEVLQAYFSAIFLTWV